MLLLVIVNLSLCPVYILSYHRHLRAGKSSIFGFGANLTNSVSGIYREGSWGVFPWIGKGTAL